jgi:hypothetical protein
MVDDLNIIVNLANRCEDQADILQALQKSLRYQGPDIARLHATEMTLRSKALLLNTVAMGAALSADADVQKQLESAIAQAKKVTKTVQAVQLAIQISADLISLAGGIVSDNPAVIIAAAAKTITDATTSPAPHTAPQ